MRTKWPDFAAIAGLVLAALVRYSNSTYSCNTWLASDVGDNTAGIPFWGIWEQGNRFAGPAQAVPLGESLPRQGIQLVTSALTEQFALLSSRVFGLICGFNALAVTFALITTLCAYWLLRSLPQSNALLCTLGAAILGLGPYTTFMGHTHIQWVGHFPLLLVLGLAIRMAIKPSAATGALAGLATLLTFLAEPHMPLAAVGILCAVAVSTTLSRFHCDPQSTVPPVRRLLLSLLGFLVTLFVGLILLGLALLRVSSTNAGLGLPNRSVNDIWGATLPDYFAIGTFSRLSRLLLQSDSLEYVNDSQIVAQYFAGVFALSGVAFSFIFFVAARRTKFNYESSIVMGSAVALVFTGFLLAAPAEWVVLGIKTPTLPTLIYELLPSYRFYWRYLYLVLLGLLIWGIQGWGQLIRKCQGYRRGFVYVLAVSLALLDLFLYRDFIVRGFNFAYTPNVYTWLADEELQEGESVAQLTFDVPSLATWQTVHQKPLANGAPPGTNLDLAIRELNGFVQPQVACLANTLGIRFLLRHTSDEPLPAFPRQELVQSFRFDGQAKNWPSKVVQEYSSEAFWYDVDVYENDGRGTTGIFLSYGPGFGSGTFDGTRGIAAMDEPVAFLGVNFIENANFLSTDGPWLANFDIRGGVLPQPVSIKRENGETLWEGPIGQDWQRISFESTGDDLVQIRAPDATAENRIWIGRFGAGDCP